MALAIGKEQLRALVLGSELLIACVDTVETT
jgi:hypothetical protein